MSVVAKVKQLVYRVGDLVRFQLGARLVQGRVVEDRGNIGIGCEQLVRVSVYLDPLAPHEFEMPASELTLAKAAVQVR